MLRDSLENDSSNEPTSGKGCAAILGPLLGILLLLALLALALMPRVRHSSAPNYRRLCESNLRLLSTALMSYREHHGRFPPPCIYDKNGKPMHSWRVLMLPYLEENVAYSKYDFKQPWNSPDNWKVIETVDPYPFRCFLSKAELGETNYLAVVGAETAWPAGKGVLLSDISDGASQTIMLVEVANSGIHWAEPRDLPLDQALLGVNPPHVNFSISSGHRHSKEAGFAHTLFCDGSVRVLEDSTPPELLRALLTRAGSEDVEFPED